MSGSYNPLRSPGSTVFPAPLEREIETARTYLEQAAVANIHDRDAMLRAATGLEYQLRSLLAALDAERGGTR